MVVYHNSQDAKYRFPFGAVKTNTRVILRISAAEADSVDLRLWTEKDKEKKVPMDRMGEFFVCSIQVPEEPCLLWYFFMICKEGKTFYYGNAKDRLGGIGRISEWEPESYQITVYKDIKTPEWFKNSICYYIFPDRFNRGSDFEKRKEAATRLASRKGPGQFFEEDWYKMPSYEKNEDGSIKRWQFYGGTLEGIIEKLPYISSLGATAIYLCPIFEAESCHRYDTADYMKIDPLLGDEEDLKRLCSEAEKYRISIVLDGVFSHTGCDSVYFDKYGNYHGSGAWHNPDSPYYRWYRFEKDSDEYECWWGDKNLPNVEELEPSHNEFICGKNGVLNKWLDCGAMGWRLDVADELPDEFIRNIRNTIKNRINGDDCLLVGEVWEDASNKMSYGLMRKYLFGEELDSVMNYPFRSALMDFLRVRITAGDFCRNVMSIAENYPKEILYCSMNMLGSHDRQRPITLLGGAENVPEENRADFRLADIDYDLAKKRLMLAAVLQYAMPGVPVIYYGDEAGVQGHTDPYNRAAFPWGREDEELQHFYEKLGLIYNWHPCLKDGSFEVSAYGSSVLIIERKNEFEHIMAMVNRNWQNPVIVSVDTKGAQSATDLFDESEYTEENGYLIIKLAPLEKKLLILKDV